MKHKFFPIVGIILLTLGACSSPLPRGQAGPPAEALADKLFAGMNHEVWTTKTAAVEFVFADKNRHFWDKNRGLVEVRFGDTMVQFKSDLSKSIVVDDGKTVTGSQARELTKKAYGYFINDAFWLNPVAHFRSPGSVRKITKDGKLLVSYTSGGVTPGDSYLITPDAKNRIKEMRMWVSVLPIKGVNAKFANYVTSDTGVTIAADHTILGFLPINISNIRMFAQYPQAGGKDRFAELLK